MIQCDKCCYPISLNGPQSLQKSLNTFGVQVNEGTKRFSYPLPFLTVEMETLCTKFRADISVTSHYIAIQLSTTHYTQWKGKRPMK